LVRIFSKHEEEHAADILRMMEAERSAGQEK
jgi:hypothetical protein